MSYRTNRHSCYDLEYHLVVVTKYRHPVIDGAFKDRLTELTYRIFEENFQCYVNEVNTDKDHIHILFEAPPQVALSSLVCSYKTVTQDYSEKNSPNTLLRSIGNPISGIVLILFAL